MLVAPTRETYEKAAAHIDRYGLHKGGLLADAAKPCGSPACAAGAILVAEFGTAGYYPGWWGLMEPLMPMVHSRGFETISAWSDSVDAAEVSGTLRTIASTLPCAS